MKEIVILSGKGGTGKTSITAALSSIAKSKTITDCDVDAADLFLLTEPKVKKTFDSITAATAKINTAKCTDCGKCYKLCQFDAIQKTHNTYKVENVACEGCGVCAVFCPEDAIIMQKESCGNWFLSDTRFGKMVHAKLNPGAENSGKLVAAVREQAKKTAEEEKSNYIITDGPPGIGCPVIASVTGADAALIITEPTMSAKSDLERITKLTTHFKIKTFVCINKSDINKKISNEIKNLCTDKKLIFVGNLNYDPDFIQAQINKKTIIEYKPNSETSEKIKKLWNTITKQISEE